MNIRGLDALTFGVDDLDAARRYLADYGLILTEASATGLTFEALDGSQVLVRKTSDTGLPAAHAPAPNIRETIYGVDSVETLEAIAAELTKDRAVTRDADGTLHARDDGNFALGFRVSRCKTILAPHVGINVPGQAPGRPLGHRAALHDAQTLPRSLSHVVYFVSDVVKAERFYVERLGFRVSDRFLNVGPFMRPAGSREHHCLFMLQSQNPHMVGLNHFTFHLATAGEVLQAGWRFEQKGYTTYWGPGQHIFGGNYFWYFNSPFGGAMEYDADMDLLADDWQPRAVPAGAENAQLMLFQSREKWSPGGRAPLPKT